VNTAAVFSQDADLVGIKNFQAKLVRYLARDTVLHSEQFGEIGVILVSPNLLSVGSVQQIDMQTQLIRALPDPAGQQGSHSKFAANGQRIFLPALFAFRAPPRDNPQVGKLG